MSYTGLIAIMRREIHRVLRIWTQSFVPPILTSSLFILIFGFSLGSRISEVGGVSYLEFILPGLLMMGVITSSYMHTSSSLYLARFQGSIQELLVAPIPYWQIIAGITSAALLRSFIVGLGILLVSMIFTSITIFNIFILLYFIIMVALMFAFAGIVTALWANNFDQMGIFSTFLITPLTYLGGVFYSITMLPGIWQNIARFNPILYMVDGFRYGFIGVKDINIWFSAGLVFILTTFFFLLCVHLFRTGYKLRT